MSILKLIQPIHFGKLNKIFFSTYFEKEYSDKKKIVMYTKKYQKVTKNCNITQNIKKNSTNECEKCQNTRIMTFKIPR